ncbi:hypothetical protein Bpfe_008015 [Biomphalaria pfeifferi]|uniref:Uncharacterized protein n=1 Tax=Biomphalaria pfeifferi TaxID=112525 RepID=A0AAD8FGJ4_BIOPF|nr:hypothetical protein Bpfe_008015 [Biomphalaria pfeifferi]
MENMTSISLLDEPYNDLNAFVWPPKPAPMVGNIRKGPMRLILLSFPTYSLRASMVLLIVLATLVIYHVFIHVAKLILEVRKMALELNQPLGRPKNPETGHAAGKDEHAHQTGESNMQLLQPPSI